MTASQQVQQCVQQCMQVRDRINSMAGAETNPQVKMMLQEGAHHLSLCLEECNFVVQQSGAMMI